jgi:hypothetical protein
MITKGFMYRENADKFAKNFPGAKVTITHRGYAIGSDRMEKRVEVAS